MSWGKRVQVPADTNSQNSEVRVSQHADKPKFMHPAPPTPTSALVHSENLRGRSTMGWGQW